jgi:hypothetical protein
MKISRRDALSAREKKKIAQRNWHRWFAWFPVYVSFTEMRWLETVERRRVEDYADSFWEYRRG